MIRHTKSPLFALYFENPFFKRAKKHEWNLFIIICVISFISHSCFQFSSSWRNWILISSKTVFYYPAMKKNTSNLDQWPTFFLKSSKFYLWIQSLFTFIGKKLYIIKKYNVLIIFFKIFFIWGIVFINIRLIPRTLCVAMHLTSFPGWVLSGRFCHSSITCW